MRNQLRLVVGVIGALALALQGLRKRAARPANRLPGGRRPRPPRPPSTVIGDSNEQTPPTTTSRSTGSARFSANAGFLYVAMTVTDLSGGSKEMGAFFNERTTTDQDPGEEAPRRPSTQFGADSTTATPAARSHVRGHQRRNETRPATAPTTWEPVLGSEVTLSACSPATSTGARLLPRSGDTVGLDLMYVLGGTGFMYPGAVFAPSDWADTDALGGSWQGRRIVFESNRDGNLEIYSRTRTGLRQRADRQPVLDLARREEGRLLKRPGAEPPTCLGDEAAGPHAAGPTDPRPEQQPAWSPERDEDRLPGQRHRQYDIFIVTRPEALPWT